MDPTIVNTKKAYAGIKHNKLPSRRFMEYFINRAIAASSMSRSEELKVGAVVVRDNRTIIDAWNGTPPGWDNEAQDRVAICKICNSEILISKDKYSGCDEPDICCPVCGYDQGLTKETISNLPTLTRHDVSHAEENIITYAANKGISLNGCDVYITVSPCEVCARLIHRSGIKRVFYLDKFKRSLGDEHLEKANIPLIRLTRKGEVV